MEAHTRGTRPLGCVQQFGGDPTAVADARAFAVAAVTRWGIVERADDIRLCVSELATNAVTHGGPCTSGFALRVIASSRCLRVEVGDDGAGRPVRRLSTCEETSGRGLQLVDALADAWGVDERAIGKTVWAEFLVNDADAVRPAEPTEVGPFDHTGAGSPAASCVPGGGGIGWEAETVVMPDRPPAATAAS